jgi:hypothetical protein
MSRRLAAALLFALLCAGATALVLARRAQPAYPVSDIAITELYTREAAHGRLLVGPYSRFGWHHPGPFLFYALAPAYSIGGSNTAALHAGALILTLVVAAGVWIVAADTGALPATLLAGVGLLVVRLPALAASPWNPHAVVLPALALVAAAAGAAAGRSELLPMVALLASFLAQTDVALVPFVAALVVVSLRRATRSNVAAASVVAVLAWALPVVEELRHRPGNLTQLWRFFASDGHPHVTFSTALATWADALTAPFRPGFALAHGEVLTPEPSAAHIVLAASLVAGTVIAALVARQRRDRSLAWFAGAALLSSAVALWSATRIEGEVSDHFAFWMAAIGIADLATVVALLPVRARVVRAAAIAAATLVAIAGLREVQRAAGGTFAITADAPSAPNFAASIRQYLGTHHVIRPLFRIDQDQWWLAAAILLELDREGVVYAVEDDWKTMFPDRFAPNGSEDAELTLAAAHQHAELAARSGNVTVDVSSFIHVEAITGSAR